MCECKCGNVGIAQYTIYTTSNTQRGTLLHFWVHTRIPSEAKLAIYSIGGQKWHEVYFPLSGAASSASSNELDCQKLLLL